MLIRQGLIRRIDHARLPHLVTIASSFLDRPYDPGNAHSTPYFWGTTGIAYDRTRVPAPIDSWSALWDERLRGRILMLDDPREAFMAALKVRGHSLNTTDPRVLQEARDLLIRQRPLVRTYNSTNYEDVLLSRDVWVAQGWSGQFVKAMEQDPDIVYVVPKEGSTLFIDNLAIPVTARHPDLAHAFLDFAMEPEIDAEICRTMRYSTTSREALPLLPLAIRNNPAMFPPPTVFDRLEMIRDLGETTVLYDRLWTEVKSAQ